MSLVHEHHVRQFVAARERGDDAEMRRWWEEIVIDVFPHMDGFVGTVHKGALGDQEHDLAVSMVLARFSTRYVRTFRGTTGGELVKGTETMVTNIVKDVIRRSIAERERFGGSLDAWDPRSDEDAGPGWEVGPAQRRAQDDDLSADTNEFLAWALPRMTSAKERRATEMSLAGHATQEIQDELGVRENHAHVLVSRGLKRLRELKQEFDG